MIAYIRELPFDFYGGGGGEIWKKAGHDFEWKNAGWVTWQKKREGWQLL